MKRDRRLTIFATIALAGYGLGLIVHFLPERARELPAETVTAPVTVEPAVSFAGDEARLHELFQQAAYMLHAGHYTYALEALESVLDMAPWLPEARVNAGFALLGLSRPQQATEQFRTAIDLRREQVNAYYGLGVALEALGDLDGALGAMRTYVHLAAEDDPYRRRAMAAIWEWEVRRRELRSPGGEVTGSDADGAEVDS